MRRFFLGFAVMVFLLGVQTLRADNTPLGGPGSSPTDWSQFFNTADVPPGFDRIEVFIKTPGVFFDVVGLNTFSVAGWGSTNVTSQYAVATGPATISLNWMFNVTSPLATPFYFDLYAWNGSTIHEAVGDLDVLHWDGTNWSSSGGGGIAAYNADLRAATVPEPATLSLVGLGLVYLGKKLRKQKAAA